MYANIKQKLTLKFIMIESFILCLIMGFRSNFRPLLDFVFFTNNDYTILKSVFSSFIIYILISLIRILLTLYLNKDFNLKTSLIRFKNRFNLSNTFTCLIFIIFKELLLSDIPIFSLFRHIIYESSFDFLIPKLQLTEIQVDAIEALPYGPCRRLILNTQ